MYVRDSSLDQYFNQRLDSRFPDQIFKFELHKEVLRNMTTEEFNSHKEFLIQKLHKISGDLGGIYKELVSKLERSIEMGYEETVRNVLTVKDDIDGDNGSTLRSLSSIGFLCDTKMRETVSSRVYPV